MKQKNSDLTEAVWLYRNRKQLAKEMSDIK